MRVALMIEGQEGVAWDHWRAIADVVDSLPFDALFRSDHYVPLQGDEHRGALDAWATLAALAAATERVRLGTLVSPVTFRHPSLLAKLATTVDHVSDGRVEVGIGAGWNDREHAAYGFPYPDLDERFSVFEEQVEIVRRLLTEEVVDHDGDHYRLEAVRPLPRPVQDPLPLLVGGLAGPRSARLAARFADEYNTVFATLDELGDRRRQLDTACEEQGRDPDDLPLSLMTGVIVATSPEELRRRAGRVLERQGEDGDPEAFLDTQRGSWIVGLVDEVVDQLGARRERGVTRVMLQLLDHTDLDAVALIGEEVAPALA